MWTNGLKRENEEKNQFSKRKLVKKTLDQCARECTYEKTIAAAEKTEETEGNEMDERNEMNDILTIILPPIDSCSPEKQILIDLTRSAENQNNRNDDFSSVFLNHRSGYSNLSSLLPLTKTRARERRFRAALSRQEDLLHIRSAGCFQNGVCMLSIEQETLNEVEKLAKEYIENIQPHPKYMIRTENSMTATTFLRPDTKLFDLVRKAVFNSPHAILHVKSIYAAILKRYPYFKTLDQKSFINWKSGLRHALSVQWAFKVQFKQPFGLIKGYYYVLLDSPLTSEDNIGDDLMTKEDPMFPLAEPPASASGSATPTSLGRSESPGTKGWSPLEPMFASPTVMRMVNHSPLISQASATSGFKSQESGYESLGSQFNNYYTF